MARDGNCLNNARTGTPCCRRIVQSPVGRVEILWAAGMGRPCSIIAIILPGESICTDTIFPEARACTGDIPEPLVIFEKQLRLSLEGSRADFSPDLLDLDRLYPFQKKVLLETFRIPRGQTLSYGKLARQIGSPGAARAVGTALARNPFPLVLPCHRVVKACGGVGGFGGGAQMKRELLIREGVLFNDDGRVSPSCRMESP